jgi:hypothetical protein
MHESFLNIDPLTGVPCDKKAILIVGPESTGTKLLAKCFIQGMGCAGNDVIDGTIAEGKDPIMVRFSLPAGPVGVSKFVDIAHVNKHLRSKGYDVHAVITSRNWQTMMESGQRQCSQEGKWIQLAEEWEFRVDPNSAMVETQAKDKGEGRELEQTKRMIQAAYVQIFKGLVTDNIPFVFSNYEGLISDPENHLKSLADMLGLEYSGIDFEIRNENKKYFKVKV